MSSYFYITIDETGTRPYCNLGVTSHPRVRLDQYNMEQNRKYALLVEYKCMAVMLLELEKLCLEATINYNNLYNYGCSIEGRAGDIGDIVKICKDIISNWSIKGKYIEYNELDYVITNELKTIDFAFRVSTSEYFNKFYAEKARAQLAYDAIFDNSKHIKAIYDFARVQNRDLNIKTVSQYLQHVEQNKTLGALNAEHMKYALKPKEYFSSVWTNWYDYLGVDSTHFIKFTLAWKYFCTIHEIYTVSDYEEACHRFKELMPDPGYWFTDFGHLSEELPKKRKRG